MMTLPANRMISLCKDDKLHIKHEGQLLRLIDRYLEKRKDLPKPLEEQDAVARKDWAALAEAGVLTEAEAD